MLTLLLVCVTGLLLFVPVAKGASDVKSMFVLLTGIAVRDYFASRTADTAEAPRNVTSADAGR